MSTGRLNINEWDEADRPREKLMALGAEALSNAELLAILIGSGTPDENAVELMKRVLADCDNKLNTLGRMSIKELTGQIDVQDPTTGRITAVKRYKGLGQAKAVTIMAACELGKRRLNEGFDLSAPIKSSVDLYNHLKGKKLDELAHEECHVLMLNQANRVISSMLVSKGGMTEASVDIRMIMREALLQRATVMVLAHNHPSGNLKPSRQDNDLTHRLYEAAKVFDIRLLDHIIVSFEGYYSYNDEGTLIP